MSNRCVQITRHGAVTQTAAITVLRRHPVRCRYCGCAYETGGACGELSGACPACGVPTRQPMNEKEKKA